MIKSFRHRGLKRLFAKNDSSGVRADQLRRIRQVLNLLDGIEAPEEMDLPGLRLHPLKGSRKGFWSVTISGNWRIVFRFEKGAVDVELIDYH